MTIHVIDLNDALIRVFRDGIVVCASPGIAIVERGGILTGVAAQARAHLNPRMVNSRFWQQLNEVPLPGGNRKCRHNADLAYHHLDAILEESGRPSEVIIAVPGSFDQSQLSLLLGIASACNLKVLGLVDAAVAAVSGTAAQGHYTLAELYQHHAAVTEIVIGETVRRVRVQLVDQSGLNRMYEACVDLIADAFLEQSRFDPLHEAETEQLLYVHLPAWLEEASRVAELKIAVDYRGTRFAAKIATREFVRVTQMVVSAIREQVTADSRLLLSAQLAALPGCGAHLAPATVLPPDAVYLGIAEHRLAFATGDTGVAFSTELPASGNPVVETLAMAEADSGAGRNATHILAGDSARPLSTEPLYLKLDGTVARDHDGVSCCSIALANGVAMLTADGADARLNGQAVSGKCRLNPGDHITLIGGRALFIPIVVER